MAAETFPAQARTKHAVRRRLAPFLAGVVLVLLAAATYLYWPISPVPLRVPANPAGSYDDALARLEAMGAPRAGESLHPLCGQRVLTHGQPQPRVIVLVHGYTDCPQQFVALGELFYARGYNVVIARLPRHGLADRLNETQAELTAEELTAHAGALVDAAQGLGDHVTMLGLSGGAMVTGWAAQERADLDRAVLLAPAFGYRELPTPLTRPAVRLFALLPNEFRWWDAEQQAAALPLHGYPRYATRTLAQILRLGEAIQTASAQQAPAADSVLVVTNANDDKVNNALTALIAARWRAQGGQVDTYTFPAELGLPHDFIEPVPAQPWMADINAQLVELVER